MELSNQKSQMDQEYGLVPADALQQLRRRRRTFKKYSGILFLLIQSFMTTILAVLNYVECLLLLFFFSEHEYLWIQSLCQGIIRDQI